MCLELEAFITDDNSGILHINCYEFANCIRKLLIYNETNYLEQIFKNIYTKSYTINSKFLELGDNLLVN
jgi:hypothetical protein